MKSDESRPDKEYEVPTPETDSHLAHLNLADGQKIGIPDVTLALLRQLERERDAARCALFVERCNAPSAGVQTFTVDAADKLLRDGEPIGFRTMPIRNRIEEALKRIREGRAYMRIPADQTDPDIVLADCLTLLSTEGPHSLRGTSPGNPATSGQTHSAGPSTPLSAREESGK